MPKKKDEPLETGPTNPVVFDQFNDIKPAEAPAEAEVTVPLNDWADNWMKFNHPKFKYIPEDSDDPKKIIGSIFSNDPDITEPLINVTNDNKMMLPKFEPGSKQETAQIKALTASLDHLVEQNKGIINADNPLIIVFKGMDKDYLKKIINELKEKTPPRPIKLQSPDNNKEVQDIIKEYNDHTLKNSAPNPNSKPRHPNPRTLPKPKPKGFQ